MTEYEYIDALATLRDSAGFHAMNYIALLFGYVIAGYFAANSLTTFQVVAVTLLYLILCPMPGIAAYEVTTEFLRLQHEFHQNFRPDEALQFWAEYTAQAWLVAFITTLFLSIVFMIQSRMVRAKNAAAT